MFLVITAPTGSAVIGPTKILFSIVVPGRLSAPYGVKLVIVPRKVLL